MEIFPGNSLLVEEFAKVIALAETMCSGEPAREEVKKITARSEFTEVLRLLEETEEMRKMLSDGEPFPGDAYPDARESLKFLQIRNAVLSVAQTMQIRDILVRASSLFSFIKLRAERFPLLWSRIAEVIYEPKILLEIETVMDETGWVKSTASQDLGRIRRQLSRKRIEAEQLYQQTLQKYRKSGWLSDAQESWRNGRRVISIVAEQKRTAKGIIHDISSTGKTCFIEPEEAIPVNNMVLSLEEEERQEIIKILRELSEFLRSYQAVIHQYFQHIVQFDVIHAKAGLAIRMKASLPYVVPQPLIDLQEAVHPLLFMYNVAAGKPTIPFTLKLEGDHRILVISGPNAGGKTVCLKTAGLLQMMLQSGLLVTADGNSRFGIFKHLLVDIGDSQSLEFELSTYSSRLKHMQAFIRKASAGALFLIDEFGTGTDPALGGALAEAILEELNYKQATGIVTTHYMNLKALADRTKGIINGSMAFDARKLEPLFRLEVGKPGSSYTFVVAERSGLPGSVIQRARKKVKKNTLLLEELLNKLEKEKAEVHRLMELNRNQEKKLDYLVNKYEKNVANQEQRYEQNEERVRQKEMRLAKQMEDQISRFVREWKDSKNKKALLEKYDKKLQERKKVLNEKDRDKLEAQLAYNKIHLKKGVLVRLRNGKVQGVVQEIRDEKVMVLFGNVKTLTSMQDLIMINEATG